MITEKQFLTSAKTDRLQNSFSILHLKMITIKQFLKSSSENYHFKIIVKATFSNYHLRATLSKKYYQIVT